MGFGETVGPYVKSDMAKQQKPCRAVPARSNELNLLKFAFAAAASTTATATVTAAAVKMPSSWTEEILGALPTTNNNKSTSTRSTATATSTTTTSNRSTTSPATTTPAPPAATAATTSATMPSSWTEDISGPLPTTFSTGAAPANSTSTTPELVTITGGQLSAGDTGATGMPWTRAFAAHLQLWDYSVLEGVAAVNADLGLRIASAKGFAGQVEAAAAAAKLVAATNPDAEARAAIALVAAGFARAVAETGDVETAKKAAAQALDMAASAAALLGSNSSSDSGSGSSHNNSSSRNSSSSNNNNNSIKNNGSTRTSTSSNSNIATTFSLFTNGSLSVKTSPLPAAPSSVSNKKHRNRSSHGLCSRRLQQQKKQQNQAFFQRGEGSL
ncbi:hypothetical protein PG985_015078 [Apiospora marii]|uniref:uncharacterized protein n=1 Tax=Apiospora marii TaxID=335849 RepID=UPI00312E17D1